MKIAGETLKNTTLVHLSKRSPRGFGGKKAAHLEGSLKFSNRFLGGFLSISLSFGDRHMASVADSNAVPDQHQQQQPSIFRVRTATSDDNRRTGYKIPFHLH